MKNVIVTGGTGFIGSWLINELLENDVQVTVVVRNRAKLLSEIATNQNCSIIEKDFNLLSKSDFALTSYDAFFHLAWEGVSPECKNNVDMQLNNISMALHILEVCKDIGCEKFIASGTVAEYVFCTDIMDIHAKQSPNDMYGAAKVSAHYFLEVRARQLKQPFIWAVIPSTFGERRLDNNIITYTIRTLLRGDVPQYGNLEQMWDFLYVKDVVRALRLIAEKGQVNHVYGIGSGQYMSLREYITRIRDIIDPSLELGIGCVPQMSQQTFSSCVNTYDLIKDTGFRPQITFEEGINRTIAYLQEVG